MVRLSGKEAPVGRDREPERPGEDPGTAVASAPWRVEEVHDDRKATDAGRDTARVARARQGWNVLLRPIDTTGARHACWRYLSTMERGGKKEEGYQHG